MVTGSHPSRSFARALRVARSLLFFLSYLVYLLLVMVPVQRLVLWPLVSLWSSRRRAILGAWLRLQARVVLGLARALAGVHYSVQGSIEPTSCIVVMNHQSVLDIPLGVSMMRGPYPLIPTRARYRRGIPGISMLTRMIRFPFVAQGRAATREDLEALSRAADQVAHGDQSFLIFPEGHRSRNGEILPFMTAGLRLVLDRARQRPVYVVVVDGTSHLRTSADTALHIAGTRGQVAIMGPYTIPPEKSELGRFIEDLRAQMVETLCQNRAARAAAPALAIQPRVAP